MVIKMIELKTIGVVRNKFKEQIDPEAMQKHKSTIVIDPKYEEGLYRIDECKYIQVIFKFHLSEGYNLKGPRRNGQVKGVFASCSPKRPSGVGVTTVKLIGRKGRELIVKGLDALDGTPVLDIKPYVAFLSEAEQIRVSEDHKKTNPRSEINVLIRKGDLKALLLKAAEIHGHFCPGLSFGVIGGAYSMRALGINSEGMEKLLAIVEANNCFSDGIQFVTGCSFGNNALIYRDYGKTAVTVTKRDGQGLRLSLNSNAWSYSENRYPRSRELFQRVVVKRKGDDEDMRQLLELFRKISFEVIELDFETLFNVEKVQVNIPDYAPIFEDIICSRCGESIISTRVVEKGGEKFCIPCSGSEYFELDGSGIKYIRT
jgi:formylmethanofuran dehydrogenase subunit E